MQKLDFDATKLYGYKILKNEKNQPIALNSMEAEAKIGSKVGAPKKVGSKVGDKVGIKIGSKVGQKQV
jgi:hypothetical protein